MFACVRLCACVRVGSAITHRFCNTSALGCSTLCCPSAPLFWPRSGAQHFGAQHWRSTLTLSCPCHSVLSGDLVALTPSCSAICGDQPPLAFDRGSRPLRWFHDTPAVLCARLPALDRFDLRPLRFPAALLGHCTYRLFWRLTSLLLGRLGRHHSSTRRLAFSSSGA